MTENHCSKLPNWLCTYDRSGACLLHDLDYMAGINWFTANWNFLERLCQCAPGWLAWSMWLIVQSPIGYYYYLKTQID